MKNQFYISTDKTKLDIEVIHNYLSKESYWAKGRTLEAVETTIENSVCFGVYEDEKQIGFARVASDLAVFAYIMDVFVLDAYRGNGLGKLLMDSIINNELLRNVQIWMLATDDAHGLYRQYGFKPLPHPEKMMIMKL